MSHFYCIPILFCLTQIMATETFSVCDSEPSTCVPLSDFQFNCTCFLLHSREEFNKFLPYPMTTTTMGSDIEIEVDDYEDEEKEKSIYNMTGKGMYLRGPGFHVPLDDYKFFETPDSAKNVLSRFVVQDYGGALERPLPDVVFESYEVQEHYGLFAVDLELLENVINHLVKSVIFSEESVKVLTEQCVLGQDCQLFNAEQLRYDNETRTYTYVVELARGFGLQAHGHADKFLMAYSSAKSTFQLNKLERQICRRECKHLEWVTRRYCRKKCNHEYRHYNMAFTGRLKFHWQNYVRGVVVHNLRQRYKEYFPWLPD